MIVAEATCHARSQMRMCHTDLMNRFLLNAAKQKKIEIKGKKNNCRGP